MYAQFYGLRESPFALTPDPRYLFLSEPHKEALASAVYGVQERKGFVLILGEVGTGKTTLIRHLLGRFGPNIRSVFVFNPAVTFLELLQLMLRDLELPCGSLRRVEMIDTLNEYLLREASAGRYVVVIIDEAQHLSPTVLEEVRMLSNLETAKGKLIQILLVGQPELGEKLGRPELRQLRQRISLVAELKPLSYEDTVHYITHRLGVAGHQGPNLFSPRALRLIHRASDGIPRLVNVICDKALVLGYGADKKRITSRIVREVLKDWRHFQQRPAAATVRARTRAGARARGAGRRPLARRAAVALACLVGAALVVAAVTHRDGDLLGRVWRGLRPAGASGTVASAAPMLPPPAPRPGAGQTRPSAELAPALPARAEAREAAPPAPESAPPPPLTAKAEPASLGAARGSSREVVVGPGEVFSGLVTRHYGFAELTLLDFVKSANPNVDSIDMVLVGQKLKLPPFEPAALVHAAGSSGYRLHLMTVWDTQSQMIQKLRPAVTNLGRQLYVVPVSLTSKDTAYRVLVGDFADRQEAEAFYRSFRAPAGVSSQLWK